MMVKKNSELGPVGIPFVRGGDIRDGWIETNVTDHIRPEFADRVTSKLTRSGDVAFITKGTVGRVRRIREAQPSVVLAPQVAYWRSLDESRLDSRFLFYLLKGSDFQSNLDAVKTHGSMVADYVSLSDQRLFQLTLPPIRHQKRAAEILGTLDDKIELNRRMNDTLEGLARAIFRSWFVDFDPVRAKRDGVPASAVSPATAALFPDSFEDSELGRIPKGWSIDTIKNRASSVQYGYTQSASSEPMGPRFLRITDIRGGQVDWSAVPYCKANDDDLEKYRIKDGDIFVARTGASTGDNIYVIDPPDSVFASYLVRFQFASSGIARFVGEFMRTPDYFSHVAGSIGGSAQPNTSAQNLADAKAIFPTTHVADEFFKTVRPLDFKRAANLKESERLAAIRDALIPKLLSGEIRVAQAERVAERSV